MRGHEFSHYAASSILARRLREAGYAMTGGSRTEDKDFGDAVAEFDTGYLDFQRGDEKLHLYQSRFSDNWALDGPAGRTQATAFLASRTDMNDPVFVDVLLEELAGSSIQGSK